MGKRTLLLIVDAQVDFMEGGNLPIEGATNAMLDLSAWLNDKKKDFVKIVLTADWHPTTHSSFKEHGGPWPTHCLQHSKGASIFDPILKAINDTDYSVLTKGLDEDHEEYSIWKNMISSRILHDIVSTYKVDEIVICGLAGDICVLNSLKDSLKELPKMNFKFIKQFSPCIGDGSDVEKFVQESERVEFFNL